MSVLESPNVALNEAARQQGVLPDGSFELPSGKVCRMRAGKGKDIVQASRVLGTEASNPMALVLAVAAQKCTIDGQPVTYEELLELDDEDCWQIISRAQKGKALSPPTTSPS